MTNFLKIIKIIFLLALTLIIVLVIFLFFDHDKKTNVVKFENYSLVGPRQNIPADSPTDYNPNEKIGFWSFAIPVDGALSRSGQPTYNDFKWLRENGWKSVVDTRPDNEYNEISNDQKIPGFNELNFNYLHIPITDNTAPNDEQAKLFLDFVTQPKNKPIHLHCRAGIGRTGTLTALYRYSVQGWPITEAINETNLYGGINDIQKDWLKRWAENNEPGQYNK